MKTKTMLAACAALGLGWGANEASGQSLLENLQACVSKADDATRLKCYDEQMAALGVRKSAEVPAPPAAPAPPPKPAIAREPAVAMTAPAPTRAPEPAAVSPVPVPAKPAPVVKTPAVAVDQQFGLPVERVRSKEPGQLSSRVRSVSERAHGELSIELENGQVWAQTERRSTFRVEPGETVTIRPGKLGSYFLSTEAKLSARVVRLR